MCPVTDTFSSEEKRKENVHSVVKHISLDVWSFSTQQIQARSSLSTQNSSRHLTFILLTIIFLFPTMNSTQYYEIKKGGHE